LFNCSTIHQKIEFVQPCGKFGEIKSNLVVLGLVIFYCMMGEHAFAVLNNLPKCEENIKINKSRISKSGIYKEGRNFINQLLSPIPENRYVSLFLFSLTVSLMFELKIYVFVAQGKFVITSFSSYILGFDKKREFCM
jgi:serine/threonine protein kinase